MDGAGKRIGSAERRGRTAGVIDEDAARASNVTRVGLSDGGVRERQDGSVVESDRARRRSPGRRRGQCGRPVDDDTITRVAQGGSSIAEVAQDA